MSRNIKLIIQAYLDEEKKDFQRFQSWKHCFEFFRDIYFKNESSDDIAALHLGFYLASWGMYRGSTFLLQNDYKIHVEIVKYAKEMKDTDFSKFENIQKLKEFIIHYYQKNANHSSTKSTNVTDTLVTKILLGIFGCIPAYDEYLKKGLRLNNLQGKMNKISFEELNTFYENNKLDFQPYEKSYPRMKLLDMYFWKLGEMTIKS